MIRSHRWIARWLCALLVPVALVSAADASVITAVASLSGAQEVPPNSETATGSALLSVDTETQLFDFFLDVKGITIAQLRGVGPNLTPFHLHLAPAGANGPIVVDLGFLAAPVATADGFTLSIDDATFGGAYGAVAGISFSNLLAALIERRLYVNVHTQTFPAGQIRGQMVPEPGTLVLAGLGAGIVLAARQRRRSVRAA